MNNYKSFMQYMYVYSLYADYKNFIHFSLTLPNTPADGLDELQIKISE